MKTRFNFRFLLVLSGVATVGAVVVVAVHACQVAPEAAALLADANRAEAAGDFPRAADYLRRRLVYTPGDADILERYGRTLARDANTDADRDRVLSVYQDVLAREPTRNDLRREAVGLAMGLGYVAQARDHLELLAHYRPDDAEVPDLLGQCLQTLGDANKAEAAYRAAISLDPARTAAYVRLAGLLRGRLGRDSEADVVMDAMIDANGRAAVAYVERAVYRVGRGELDDAEKDAARARELAPDDARVLLTAADLAARRGRPDDARAALRHGLDLHPDDMDLRLAAATLDLKTGRPADAADGLEAARRALQGRKSAPDQGPLIDLLAEARLRLGDTAKVEELAAEHRAAGRTADADYLTARLRMHDGRWADAARTLEESARASVLSPEQAVRTLLCLGECYGRLGEGDRRLVALREAVADGPSSAPAGEALGAALLETGRTDEALDQLRRTTQLPEASEEAWALLARALLLHAKGLPAGRQDWTEVDGALDRVADGVEAAALRAAALRSRGEESRAAALLENARSAHPAEPAAWTALALDAARRGDAAGAIATLNEARRRLGDLAEFRFAVLDVYADAGDEAGLKTLADLEKSLDRLGREDRTRLLGRLANAYYRAGKGSDGDRLCRLAIAEPAADLSARLPLIDVVLASRDVRLVEDVLADVARLEGEGGVWQEYGRAAWLVTRAVRGDRAGTAEAKRLLGDLSQRRPDWPRVALLRGRVAGLEGDADGELDGYQRAFDQGERSPDVATALADMLAARERWDDADRVLHKLQERVVFRGALARRAAEVALQAQNGERAGALARLAAPAVDAYPYHVWLGRLLASAGQPSAAEEELRRAVRFPNAGWDATAALASFLAVQSRAADAEATVEAYRATLPPHSSTLPLGECYEAAGRLERAGQCFDEAVARRPDDGPTLARAASFELRLNRPARAEPLFRRLLDSETESSRADVAWARRELAMILASEGGPRYDEALTLLGTAPRPGEDAAAYRRARAFVLGARPEGRAEALGRLEEEARVGPLPADEQFRLAGLYDAADRWPEARERLIALLAADRQNPEYLACFADALLRHGQADEAGAWLARLEGLEPGSERVKLLRSRLQALTPAP